MSTPTPEQKLAALLRSDASDDVPLRGDGLASIQARIARKRRLHRVLLPIAGLAVSGAAAAAFLLGGTEPTSHLSVEPGASPTSCGSFSYGSLQESLCPTPPVGNDSPPPSTDSPYTGPTLFSYTSPDKDDVVRHWLTSVGIDAVPLRHTCESCDEVPIGVGGRQVGSAFLARNDIGGQRTFSLVSVTAADLTVTSPKEGSSVTPPLTVTGTLRQGVDESVLLRLVTSSGTQVAQASAPAGSAVPWSGTLSWTDRTWSAGAVVGTTVSARDGSLTRLFAVAVTQTTSATPGTFVGLVQGHVSALDPSSGAVLRQLTYPPAGKTDTGAAWNGSALVWVRSQQTGCADELDQSVNGTASTLVAAGANRLGTPRLSPDRGVVAYVATPCSGGAATVVVRTATGNHVIALRQSSTTVADVRDDGTVLLHDPGAPDHRRIVLVPPSVDAISYGTPLNIPPGCTVTGGAFDGQVALGWESCSDGVRLTRFDDSGSRIGAGRLLPTSVDAKELTVSSGVLLAWLSEGPELGRIVRVTTRSYDVVVSNHGCAAADSSRCVRSPSW